MLGYPDQALSRSREALRLARELSHSFSQAHALICAAGLHLYRREVQAAQEQAAAAMELAREHEFSLILAMGTIVQGWVLAGQGQEEDGIAHIRRGLFTFRATGAELIQTHWLASLAEVYGKVGMPEHGLHALAEALALATKNGERYYEAELYRLKGTLTHQFQAGLAQAQGKSKARQNKSGEVATYLLKAIDIARRQQAKLLELRAAVSLGRLWQHQGKKEDARQLLAEIYGWFTEGFDTPDLQEARALLTELESMNTRLR
jgi:predicted ATPase